jgi:hypothetical protein
VLLLLRRWRLLRWWLLLLLLRVNRLRQVRQLQQPPLPLLLFRWQLGPDGLEVRQEMQLIPVAQSVFHNVPLHLIQPHLPGAVRLLAAAVDDVHVGFWGAGIMAMMVTIKQTARTADCQLRLHLQSIAASHEVKQGYTHQAAS